MSDLISRQAAIDEIDEWIKAFLENGHKESAADACLIQDGIIQLPFVQSKIDWEKVNDAHNEGYDVGYWAGRRDYAQHWIPCSKRLPEIDKEVLVTDGKICWVCSLFESPDIEDGFYQWEDNYGHWHEFDTWIAWMPLPEPFAERLEE